METLREIGSSVSKLRSLLSERKRDLQHIQTLQTSLTTVLNTLWSSAELPKLVESPPIWREFVSLIASGRVLSTSAEAETALEKSQALTSKDWTGEGRLYARWLGTGVVQLTSGKSETFRNAAAVLCGKSFGLGYKGKVSRSVRTVIKADVVQTSWLRQYSMPRRWDRLSKCSYYVA